MSTIKVDTIATRTGSGNITVSNTIAGTSATLSGDLTVDTSTLKVDATNNRVLIGTTTEGSVGANQLTVADSGNTGITIRAGTSSASSIYMSDATSGTGEYAGYIAYNHGSDSMAIAAASGQRIRIDADGLKFGSDTAAANALDDYEEGTWTPALSSGNSSTYDNAFGNYTKIGRFVACHFTFEIGNTFAGGTTQYLIAGLPFARSNQSNTASGSGIVHYFENIRTTAHALTLRVDSGLSIMYITGAVAANGATGLSVNSNVLQAQANLYGSVFYYTN